MSNYWKKKLDELEKEKKNNPSGSYWDRKAVELKNEELRRKAFIKQKEEEEDDIAPIKSKEDDGKLDFFQKSSLFDDGWDFGDITKTILGSVGDAGVNAVKGVGGLVEGITDLASYGVAGVADAIGKDSFADDLRKKTQTSYVDKLLKPAEDYLDKSSIFGRTSDAILQGVGQIGGIMATGGLGAAGGLGAGGVTALTTGVMGLSGMGSGMGEAYKGGATDEEAATYGLISGAADAISELIFGGLGKAVNAVGFSRGLSSADDMLAKKVSSMFSNQIAKNLSEFGIKAGAEGFEEVLAGIAQGAGKWVTYKSEEEGLDGLMRILEDENLLEQFVVGAVTSGIAQAPGLHRANKTGSDFITGLNQNEQAVVKKEIENRIAEAEADGTKLTAKEKSAIEAQVEKDLEKGYISTDLIDEIVGGETYKAYKDSVDSEDALFKEYEELGKTTNPTLAQQYRYRELDSRVKSIKDNDLRSRRKEHLDQFISEQVNGSRLAESYNEKARAFEDYKADYSKYEGTKHPEAARKTIESAIKAGASNTNRVHDFVDMVAKTSADTGLTFSFQSGEQIKAEFIKGKMKEIERLEAIAEPTAEQTQKLESLKDILQKVESGKIKVNGSLYNGSIVLNLDSPKVLNRTVGHEITHSLEKAKSYDALKKSLFAYAETKGIDIASEINNRKLMYEGIAKADPEAELVSDLVGDFLFNDIEYVNKLSVENRNVFQRIYDEIKHLLKLATAGSKEARQLEKVERTFEKAYREVGKNQVNAQRTANHSIAEIVDENQKSYGIGVHLDSTLLDDLSAEERRGMVKEYVKELGGESFTAYDANGNAVDITIAKSNRRFKNQNGKTTPVNKDLTTKFIGNEVKQESIALVDELIVTAELDGTNAPKYPHGWLDNDGKNNWEYWKTYVQDKNNTIWEATLNVANTADGEKILYDISPIKKVGQSVKSDTSLPENSIPDEGENVKYSLVEDQKTIDFLENQEHMTVYKAMSMIDGKLYPPMASQEYVEEEVTLKSGKKKTKRVRKLKNPSILGRWQQSDERPDLIKSFQPPSEKHPDGYGKFDLLKSNGKTTGDVAYNPYEHTSNIVLNDQFSEAYQRPELVTVEYQIPISEMTSGYKAKYAKDAVGLADWKAGGVAQKLKNSHRDVYLTRWSKPVRVLSDAEVAQKYKEILDKEKGISVPWNVVTPSLRMELEKAGVPVDRSVVYKGKTFEMAEQERLANTKYSLSDIKEKYKDKTDYLFLHEKRDGTISVDNMVVKQEYRNQGIGTQILNDVISYADQNGKTIVLTPTTEFGTKARLTKWYKANGFVENKGRNADYRLSDTMYRLPQSVSKDIRFSLSEAVEETKDLVALHNLTADKLTKSLELGGLPMPSLAITKADIPHSNFGEITLIFDRKTIDPKASKKNKVYSADAWTPVFPRTEYEADSKVGNRISQKLRELGSKVDEYFLRDLNRVSYGFEDYLNSEGGEEGLIQRVMDNYGLKAAYLEEQGKHIAKVTKQEEAEKGYNPNNADRYQKIMDILGVTTVDEIGKVNLKDARDNHGAELEAVWPGITANSLRMGRLFGIVKSYLEDTNSGPVYNTVTDTAATQKLVDDALDAEGYEAWVRNLFSGIVKDSGIYNNKELYTPSGNRRSFKQTHLPVTLENIVKAMASQNNGNSKNVSGFNGIKTLRAATAETFKSVEEMHKRKDRLQNRTQEEADALNDALQERLFQIIRTIDEESGQKGERNPYIRFDSIGETIAEIGEGGKYNVSDIQKAFSQYGREINDDIAMEVKQLLYDVTQMPVNIFEAKPQRVVGFDEAKVFVVPNNVDVKLKQELLNRGYSIAEYDPNVEGDRQKVVNQFEEYKFSLSDAGAGFTPVGRNEIYGKDLLRKTTPVQEEVAPVAKNATTTSKLPASYQQVTEESSVAEMFPDDLAPVQQELDNLLMEQTELRQALETAMDQGDYNQVIRLTADYEAVTGRIRELQAQEDEQFSSLSDADMPPEAEAPYPGEPNEPADPFAERDIVDVGNRSVKAYQYENPEVKPFFKEAALGMLYDLRNGTKGEKIFNGDVYYQSGGEEGWMGTKRQTTADIAELLDTWNYTYDQIEKGLNAIIEDDGKENNAVSKRIEFMLNDRLMNGYTGVWGEQIPANQEYINLLNEKQITEYSREAFDRFMATADQYAPPAEDIAPVQQKPGYVSTGSEQMKLPLYHDPNNVSPAMAEVQADEDIAPVFETESGQQAIFPDADVPKAVTRKELHASIIDKIKTKFAERGFDLDAVLKNARNLSTFATVDNIPQRVMEKALGYKEGGILADFTVNKVAQNETQGIKWLNSFTDRKNGLLAQISKKYNIKPGSKESAAAQMYAEGFYVGKNNEIISYGDRELALDFPDPVKQAQIKGLARDPRIRKIYDDTLKAINESRTRNAYPEIPRLDNYFLHFRAMNDTFSKLGLPFNPNDIRAKDLPTDLNGVTVDLKPGQPYFASAMHREGKRTDFDLLGGLEQYLTSAKNQIYHIDDIQNLRALRNYIADIYGQAHGLEDLDELSQEAQFEHIKKVYNSHLSTFAKFLHDEANVLAGKTDLLDRAIEGRFGRRGITFLDTLNRQVGSNMVGYNISSSLTNFLSPVQAFAKSNKADFIKGMAQFASNKVQSIHGNGDGFAEQSPVMIRRKGAERFHRTFWQKMSDPGYVLMSTVDDISTEIIARAKYNELTRKGMDSQTAHFETDKWVSRLMGDRSLGQQPQLYNSKMLGIITKFQLEVRNQLDSQFYDTIQEAKVSNEEIKNALLRNAKTAAKVGSTFFQLAVAQHLFGKAFESIAGYNPAFDIISAIIKTFGWDDDEEDEDTVLDNIEQGFFELMGDMPYVSTFTGGRIPIESALPIEELYKGKDQYGNEKSRWETLGEAAPYYLLPGGYGQIKKTVAGMDMFSDEHPIAGSYTDSGNLRFPLDDTLANRAQAAVFGQYASGNARDYFDNERSALKPKQIQEFIDVGMSIQDYWKYRDGLSGLSKLEEKINYINGLNLTTAQKNVLVNNLTDRKEAIDMADYDQYSSLEEFDYANKYPEKYAFFEEIGITYETYKNADDDAKKAYDWALENPDKYPMSKAIASDVVEYRRYTSELYNIKADKDSSGKSISGSRKEKVLDYINSLDIDYGAKLILFKNEYNADDESNQEIIDYLNGRSDISFEEEVAILRELGFTVTSDGTIYWD